ncbi:MAG: WcbI family polysaccharide biosynthesis putative acetyltransferase [Spirulinaceae cyanobacterium]
MAKRSLVLLPRTKVVIFGNCQGEALHKFFSLCLSPLKFDIKFYSNNVRTGEMKEKEAILRAIGNSHILIYQPLGTHHNEFSEYSLRKIVSNRTTLVSFPYFFNSGVYSLLYAPMAKSYQYGRIFGEEIIEDLLQKNSLEQVIALYQKNEIDFALENRFSSSLLEMRKRDKFTDIKLTDYIAKNYKSKKLFLNHNHPTTAVFLEILSQLENLLGIHLSYNQINTNKQNLANLSDTNSPISPYDVMTHKYEFEFHSDWFLKGKQLISLIAERTFSKNS